MYVQLLSTGRSARVYLYIANSNENIKNLAYNRLIIVHVIIQLLYNENMVRINLKLFALNINNVFKGW